MTDIWLLYVYSAQRSCCALDDKKFRSYVFDKSLTLNSNLKWQRQRKLSWNIRRSFWMKRIQFNEWYFFPIFVIGYASAGSSSSSASDGSGHTFTQSNNNGQGTFTHTASKPGGVFTQQSGPFPNTPSYGQPGYVPSFAQPAYSGVNYGPAFPYSPFGSAPVYNPIPQPNFGYNPSFQPYQPYAPFQPLATPQEFSSYLNSLQQQYAAYVFFLVLYNQYANDF